jgi:PAS domain-containing protein
LGDKRNCRSDFAVGFARCRFRKVTTVSANEGDARHQALVTDRDGVIRRWDSECVGVFGYSSEEAVGLTLDLIVPPALQARHWRGFNDSVAIGDERLMWPVAVVR